MSSLGRPTPVEPPLCVDLDGTLVKTDMLMETTVRLLAARPWLAVALPFWLAKGRAHLKREVARRVEFDPSLLPYDEELLADLRRQRRAGRVVVLATASDSAIAERIARHLDVFDRTLASDGVRNLKGEAKAATLVGAFGTGRFDYVGNERADTPVWRQARKGIDASRRPRGKLRALRPHQWAKNLLIFVPLLTAHRFEAAVLAQGAIAFVAFCLAASGIYLANDLADLDADRRHPVKRGRPLASGEMPIASALFLAPALLLAAAAVAALLPWQFGALLAAYVATSLAYSIVLKRLVLLDVFVLAGLYLLRIFAGGAAVGVVVSHWLLGFSMFVFLSLALAKRYSEIAPLSRDEPATVAGRGYASGDGMLLGALGVGTGCISAVVLSLYVTSRDVTILYRHPAILWLITPLLLYWIARVWLATFRGDLREDPLLFALRDASSYGVVCAILVVMAAAK